MDLTNWHSDSQRLRDLVSHLGLEHSASALAKMDEVRPDHRDQWMQAICEGILQEMAIHQPTKPPRIALDRWDHFATGLVGLEQMSWREMAQVDDVAKACAAGARAKAETLPALLLASCRTTIAAAMPSPADLAGTGSGQFLARLRRRLAAEILAVVRSVALQIQLDLLRQLAAATESLYPVVCASEEILHAMRHGAGTGQGAVGGSPLSTRLKDRRTGWRTAARSLEKPAPAQEAGFEVGALCIALGADSMAAGLDALSPPQLPPLSPFGGFKEAVLKAAQVSLRREWGAKRGAILKAVDQHIGGSFDGLTRCLDEWFLEVQRAMETPGSSSADSAEKLEAARLEVLDICRNVGGEGLWERSA
jgi:hypothetical protein